MSSGVLDTTLPRHARGEEPSPFSRSPASRRRFLLRGGAPVLPVLDLWPAESTPRGAAGCCRHRRRRRRATDRTRAAVARLADRAIAWHRRLGIVYITAVAIGSIGAFYLAAHTDFGWMFGAGLAGLGVAWVARRGSPSWRSSAAHRPAQGVDDPQLRRHVCVRLLPHDLPGPSESPDRHPLRAAHHLGVGMLGLAAAVHRAVAAGRKILAVKTA